MDYLAFGLLAGSLIVIASFAVRDGAPHLSAIPAGARLARLSRRDIPIAWGRWCADAGLVLGGTGTLVLIVTVGALLLGVSDDVGGIVVALSVAIAVIGSALGLARLTQRYRDEAEAELEGPLPASSLAGMPADPVTRLELTRSPLPSMGESPAVAAPTIASEPADVWDEDLPTWSSPARAEVPIAEPPGVAAPRAEQRSVEVPTTDGSEGSLAAPPAAPRAPVRGGRRSPDRADDTETQPEPAPPLDEVASPPLGGQFSSPLLADIGLTPIERDAADGFRSPLLSDLFEATGLDPDAGATSDLLIDEAPAPVPATSRLRQEVDNR